MRNEKTNFHWIVFKIPMSCTVLLCVCIHIHIQSALFNCVSFYFWGYLNAFVCLFTFFFHYYFYFLFVWLVVQVGLLGGFTCLFFFFYEPAAEHPRLLFSPCILQKKIETPDWTLQYLHTPLSFLQLIFLNQLNTWMSLEINRRERALQKRHKLK